MTLPKLLREAPRCLPNDLQMMQNPHPQHLVRLECLSSSTGLCKDMVCGLKDILRASLCRISQGKSFPQHLIANSRTKHPFSGDVHWGVQDILEAGKQSAEVHQRPVRIEVNEEVDIACGRTIAAGDRIKDPDISRTVACRETEDLLSVRPAQFFELHYSIVPDLAHRPQARPSPSQPLHARSPRPDRAAAPRNIDRKSTRLNSSHLGISYAVFC